MEGERTCRHLELVDFVWALWKPSAEKLPGITEGDPNEDCYQWGILSLNWPCLIAM